MRKTKLAIFFTVISFALFGMAGVVSAAPIVTGVTGDLNNGATVTVEGSGFGVKTTAAPKFFNTMEDVTLGTLPNGFIVKNGTGTPVDTSPSRGSSSKAMRFFADLTATDANNKEVWNRSVFDLGAGGADSIYISYWLHLDKTGTLCTSSPSNICWWQWKNTYIGSHPSAYTTNTPNETTMGINNWIIDDTGFNNVFKINYYNNLTWGGGSSPSSPTDFYLFNQWQRANIYVQRSSAPLAADGHYKVQRIGKAPVLDDTNIITNDADDLPWRYIAMGQAVVAVNENYVGTGGRVVWTAYYDDVYIDIAQARVELCDAAAWATVSHCEIQIPSAWSATSATVTLNQGSFDTIEGKYLYVIDADGNVNANGYLLTTADTTAPSAPQGLVVN